MRTKLLPATFTITHQQQKWLKALSEKTGLNQVEIVRRALDSYRDAQELKELQRMFTIEQSALIKEASRLQGVSERDLIRSAVDREVRFLTKLQRKRGIE